MIFDMTKRRSGGGTDYLAALCENTLASYTITANKIKTYTFRNATALTSVIFANTITNLGDYTFNSSGISSVHFNCTQEIPTNCFSSCSSLVTYVNTYSGAAQRGLATFALATCPNLEKVDLGTGGRLSGNAFNGSTKMNFLVIRGSAVAMLSSTNVFTGTPFASGGTGGTLYVPNSILSSYQSSTNWDTILSYANNQIRSIESTHTDPNAPIDLTLYYADGTLIPTT